MLPARFPNLLVNGSQGIAVGMATNIPPHNLGEVIDATIHLIGHPESTPDDLMAFVKGPDFPTGAQILGRQGIIDAYRTGRGSIKMRAVAEIEEGRNDTRIVVTELPYQTSVEVMEQKIHDLVRAGELDGIADTQNDSAGRKHRLVIRLKRDANAHVVLNKLYKHTPLQTSFGVNTLALVDGVPRTLNLAQVLTYYIAHQVEVLTRRSEFRLAKARARAHIVEGPPEGDRHAGRGDRRHPRVRRPARGPGRVDGGPVRVQRGAGHLHPRHDPRAVSPGWDAPSWKRRWPSCSGRSPSWRRSWATPASSGRHRVGAGGDPGQVRRRAAQRHHPRPRASSAWRISSTTRRSSSR